MKNLFKLYNSIASNCVQLPGRIKMSALTQNSSDVQSQTCTTCFTIALNVAHLINLCYLTVLSMSITAKLAGGQTTQINASTC